MGKVVRAAVAAAASVVAVGLAMVPAAMAATVNVTNNADSGPGSFRAAIGIANANAGVTSIQFRAGIGEVVLSDSVIYTGGQPLTIDGRDAAISGSTTAGTPATFDLFVSENSDDLTLRRLAFRNGRNGIVVLPPLDDDIGELSVSLFAVTVEDNAEFGLWIDDGTEPTAAGVNLVVMWSRFAGNGLTGNDLDGIRVDEGGEGDVTASVHGSVFVGNGADGLEFEEGGPGDVVATVHHSRFDGNGVRVLEEGDDGLDADEGGEGSIWLRVVRSTFNGNTDDGIGADEKDDGDLRLSLTLVDASGNVDKGLSIDESTEDGDVGTGDLEVKLVRVRAEGNEDSGAQLEEGGSEGDFSAQMVRSVFTGNGDDDLVVVQADPGTGVLHLRAVSYGVIDAEGVDVIEAGPSS